MSSSTPKRDVPQARPESSEPFAGTLSRPNHGPGTEQKPGRNYEASSSRSAFIIISTNS